MAQNLAVVRTELDAMRGQFGAVVSRSGMDVGRFMQSIMWALEQNESLGDCTVDSIKRFGMTCASLVLDPNPAAQQIFALPFKNRRLGVTMAQTVVGYKGYNTLGWRDGLTITGKVVREGDRFEFDEGTGHVSHIKKLGHTLERPIIAAYAKAAAPKRSPILVVLDLDELEAVRAKAPGAKMQDSPWNDPKVGLPAMYEKTAKRRLARSMPFGAYLAAALMEEGFEERGLPSYVDPERGVVVGDEVKAPPLVKTQPQPEQPRDLTSKPEYSIYTTGDHSKRHVMHSLDEWRSKMLERIDRYTVPQLEKLRDWNAEVMDELRNRDEGCAAAVNAVGEAIERKLKQ